MKRWCGWVTRWALLVAAVAGFTVGPPPSQAAALDVYTTAGTHDYNGRRWRTSCESYSSSVERCRTEIEAHQVIYTGGRYVVRYGWVFNNLTYKPSPRVQWIGNVLATPGDHTVDGRRWKTECDTAWTGVGACRSSIWSTTHQLVAGAYVTVPTWVFNNIVNFAAAPVTSSFCAPAPTAVQPAAAPGPGSEEPDASATPEPTALDGDDSPAPSEATPDPASASPDPVATPTAPASQSPAALPTPTPSPSPTPTPAPSPTPTPSASPTPSPTATPLGGSAQIQAAVVVPVIDSVHHPAVPGALYDRFGPIAVTGSVAGPPAGDEVRVDLTDAAGVLRSRALATTAPDGGFSALLAGGFAGRATVTVTAGGAGVSRTVDILRATVTQSVATRIDPVAHAPITGRATPSVAGAVVTAQVRTAAGGWQTVAYARPDSDGDYSVPYSHRGGWLGTHEVRVCVLLPWGATIPSATATSVTRARLASPVVTRTTAGEVATTYRSGCPVGPTQLSTIRINQQSISGYVYRGEIVVRSARATEVVDAFRRSFEAGFPVDRMTNPNAFGGDDPRMMAANNTSGFNCRRVVGNPYALSPHSYGYAVDINPWQNPYRDPSGTWWPSTDHVVRTPVVPGQLTSSSAPVVALTGHGWRWFSGWDWHHFEKR